MSHFLPTLELKILARLTGDTGAGGLCNVTTPLLAVHPSGTGSGIGVYNTTPPAVATAGVSLLPMVTYEVGEVTNDDGLREKGRPCVVTLHAHVPRSPPTGYNAMLRGAAILARLEGDWEDQPAGTAPTFGLERFKPDISAATGWLADIFEFQGYMTAHDDTAYHWIYTLGIRCSKPGV